MHHENTCTALRTAIPYLRAYKDRVFVVKIGGRLCEPGRALDHLVDQIALLHQVGIRVIVVHGAGPQADALSRRLGLEPQMVAGRRITDDAMLEVVKMSFAGTVNTNLIAAFRKAGLPAVGLSGIDGHLITARRRATGELRVSNSEERIRCSNFAIRNSIAAGTGARGGAGFQPAEIDFGHVGEIEDVSTAVLDQLLAGGYVPVACSLAADAAGNIYNINADTFAARIAISISAAKYFLVTNVDGVMRDRNDPSTLQSYLDLTELDELIASGAIADGMLPKLAACREALLGGVPRVHVVNGAGSDTLLGEVFTNEGSGTLLVRQRPEAGGVGAPPASAQQVRS